MNRIDTMDQFNRVMTTLTGSTDTANAALKQTTDIVTGTAFGLDVASRGVQAFVASGMQVSKATDTMGIWADAVSFYTKGTNAELETVSTALQKMGTKGNVTMEHLQMLLEAGVPAIQIYANAVGMSTEEVTTQMGKGELKTSDFINVMNEAFMTGTVGFPSIAGAAKKAGASWNGSIDNMRAAITRGTASMLISFDKIFNVKSGMVSFGKAVESVLKGIAENMDVIAPVTMTVVGALIAYKAAIALAPVITAAQAAMSAFTAGTSMQAVAVGTLAAAKSVETAATIKDIVATSGLTVAQTAHAAIMGVLSGQISIATAIQWLWNAAMEANPIGLIITLVALLIAGVVALAAVLSRGSEAYQQQKEEVEALGEAQKDLESRMEESEAAYTKNSIALQKQTAVGQNLLSTLGSLSKITDRSSVDNLQLKSTVESLNGAYEGLNLTIEEVERNPDAARARTEEYIRLTDAVNKSNLELDRQNELLSEEAEAQAGLDQIEIKRREIAALVEAGNLSYTEAGKLLWDLHWQEKDYNDTLKDNAVLQEQAAKAAKDSKPQKGS